MKMENYRKLWTDEEVQVFPPNSADEAIKGQSVCLHALRNFDRTVIKAINRIFSNVMYSINIKAIEIDTN